MKKEFYLHSFYLVARSTAAIFCGFVGVASMNEYGFFVSLIWVFLGGQFFLPNEAVKNLFKVNRWVVVVTSYIVMAVFIFLFFEI